MNQTELNSLDTAVSSLLQRTDLKIEQRLKLARWDAAIKEALKPRHAEENRLKAAFDARLRELQAVYEQGVTAARQETEQAVASLLAAEAQIARPVDAQFSADDLAALPVEALAACPALLPLLS